MFVFSLSPSNGEGEVDYQLLHSLPGEPTYEEIYFAKYAHHFALVGWGRYYMGGLWAIHEDRSPGFHFYNLRIEEGYRGRGLCLPLLRFAVGELLPFKESLFIDTYNPFISRLLPRLGFTQMGFRIGYLGREHSYWSIEP